MTINLLRSASTFNNIDTFRLCYTREIDISVGECVLRWRIRSRLEEKKQTELIETQTCLTQRGREYLSHTPYTHQYSSLLASLITWMLWVMLYARSWHAHGCVCCAEGKDQDLRRNKLNPYRKQCVWPEREGVIFPVSPSLIPHLIHEPIQ